MKLLIVEDERELSDSIVSFLCREDYLCEQAFSFAEAVMKVELYEYDCILLDLMLPGGNGLDVLRKIKSTSPQTGVIIVSAKDSLDDKVAGLKIGADDYLAKPFHLPGSGSAPPYSTRTFCRNCSALRRSDQSLPDESEQHSFPAAVQCGLLPGRLRKHFRKSPAVPLPGNHKERR